VATYQHIITTAYPVEIPTAGTTVVALLDAARTPLTVMRVEPMLVCVRPDGTEVTLYAHEVEIEDGPQTRP
jgi:hypothetical protein